MPNCLVQSLYVGDGAQGLRKEGGSTRPAVLEKACASMGGKLDAFDFAFGDTDVITIIDLPDNATAAGLAFLVGASGKVDVKIPSMSLTFPTTRYPQVARLTSTPCDRTARARLALPRRLYPESVAIAASHARLLVHSSSRFDRLVARVRGVWAHMRDAHTRPNSLKVRPRHGGDSPQRHHPRCRELGTARNHLRAFKDSGLGSCCQDER